MRDINTKEKNILLSEKEFILFIIQESSFQSRSILVPATKFLNVRRDEYNLLKSWSTKYKGDNCPPLSPLTPTPNLIIQKITFTGNYGTYDEHPHTSFCSIMRGYAYGLDDGCYYNMADQDWYDNSLISLCGGFDHYNNYLKCIKKYQHTIIIIDSFLILEQNIYVGSLSPFIRQH